MSTFIKDVDTAGFATDVIERSSEVPVIVDFWAEWCGPCKTLGPTLERLTTEANGTVELAKIDVDANQALAQQFGVQSIPTVIAFKDGAPVNQFVGALPEEQIREFMAGLSTSELDLGVARAEALLDEGHDEEASAILSEILTVDPTHHDAGIMLAGLLIDAGETDHAVELLNGLASSEEVRAMLAAARMSVAADVDTVALEAAVQADPDDLAAGLELAKARGAAGQYDTALETMLSIVESKVDESDAARLAMIDLFDLLGNDDETVQSFRGRLASALF
jgi:putative thioredoxin